MTPPARHAAAILIFDVIATGVPAEQALTNWARKNRYAGSKDRAAVRDIVYDVLRKKRSAAAAGGAETGRALVLGWLRVLGQQVDAIFDGSTYGPAPLLSSEIEAGCDTSEMSECERLNIQDWMEPYLRRSLGGDFEQILTGFADRAPLFVRVNTRKADKDTAITMLARDGIVAKPASLGQHALEISENPRRLRQSAAFLEGVVEPQDAASQAVIEVLELPGKGKRILDLCAGGGGKSLAMAALSDAAITASDISEKRMQDIAPRATRAGVNIRCISQAELQNQKPFDLVLVDAPCSGTGAWRRNPESKLNFTENGLMELMGLQAEILQNAAELTAKNGVLVYATCSILLEENQQQMQRFSEENQQFKHIRHDCFQPKNGHDGLFVSCWQHA